jgi:hypothetical protein
LAALAIDAAKIQQRRNQPWALWSKQLLFPSDGSLQPTQLVLPDVQSEQGEALKRGGSREVRWAEDRVPDLQAATERGDRILRIAAEQVDRRERFEASGDVGMSSTMLLQFDYVCALGQDKCLVVVPKLGLKSRELEETRGHGVVVGAEGLFSDSERAFAARDSVSVQSTRSLRVSDPGQGSSHLQMLHAQGLLPKRER